MSDSQETKADLTKDLDMTLVGKTESQALIRVHKLDSISEQTFWIGHIGFSALVLVGVAFIIFARGPRRHDAMLVLCANGGGTERKE